MPHITVYGGFSKAIVYPEFQQGGTDKNRLADSVVDASTVAAGSGPTGSIAEPPANPDPLTKIGNYTNPPQPNPLIPGAVDA